MSLAWYVVQVATNMEDKVQGALVNNIIKKINDSLDSGLTEKAQAVREAFNLGADLASDVEIDDFLKRKVVLVPKEKVEEVRNGKKRENERKIFPGYVLIHMDYNDEMGLLVYLKIHVLCQFRKKKLIVFYNKLVILRKKLNIKLNLKLVREFGLLMVLLWISMQLLMMYYMINSV